MALPLALPLANWRGGRLRWGCGCSAGMDPYTFTAAEVDTWLQHMHTARRPQHRGVCGTWFLTWFRFCFVLQVDTWEPDEARLHCADCDTEFSFLWCRRHHCRACGKLYCEACTAQMFLLYPNQAHSPSEGFDQKLPHRVCRDCERRLKRATASQRGCERAYDTGERGHRAGEAHSALSSSVYARRGSRLGEDESSGAARRHKKKSHKKGKKKGHKSSREKRRGVEVDEFGDPIGPSPADSAEPEPLGEQALSRAAAQPSSPPPRPSTPPASDDSADYEAEPLDDFDAPPPPPPPEKQYRVEWPVPL